jgi:hypothetical protein
MTMLRTLNAVALALVLSLGASSATVAHAEAPAAATKPDWKNVEAHLKQHQKYPATKADLIATCTGLADFSDGDKKWFADNLPDGTYKSASEVVKALKHAGKK